jgi:hypothetical protein
MIHNERGIGERIRFRHITADMGPLGIGFFLRLRNRLEDAPIKMKSGMATSACTQAVWSAVLSASRKSHRSQFSLPHFPRKSLFQETSADRF